MPRSKKTGNVRMKELGRVKVEVWLTASQAAALEKLAGELHMGKATAARRMINYMVRGGYACCGPIRNAYD